MDTTRPMAESRSEEPVVGKTMGRYLLLEAIGRGGCGQVYSAFDPLLDRKLAVKLLHRHARTDAEIVQEGRTLARFAHPNVLPVFDVGIEDGQAYLVMEYVEGGDLRRWSEEGPPPRAIEALVGVAMGLAAAHEAGIVHGDIKPANVLVGADGRLRISDFGIARTQTGPETASGDTDPEVAGTPAYMAPEQAIHGATEASDQYAFCLLATEVLDGVRVPPRVSAALRRGLSSRPQDRWPSMRALAHRMKPRATGRPWLIAAGGSLVVAAAAMAGKPAQTDPCAEAAAMTRTEWTAEDRAAVRTSLQDSGVPESRRAFERIGGALDDYVDHLSGLREDACRASETSNDEESRARLVCLDRAQFHVSAVVRALRASGEHADRLIGGLPNLAQCLEPDLGLPPEEVAEQVAELDDRITEVDVQRMAGNMTEADEMLDAVEAEVAEVDHARLTARAMLSRAWLDEVTDRDEEAAERLRNVLSMAIEIGHRRYAFLSSTRLGFILASRLGKLDEGLVHAELGLDYAKGLGPDPADEAMARGNLAAVLSARGNVEAAIDQSQRMLELRALAYGPRSAQAGTAHVDLAVDLRKMGRLDEAERHSRAALEIRQEALGDTHPATLRAQVNLATFLAGIGKLQEAEVLARSAIDALETSNATAFDRMLALLALAHAVTNQGRHEDAAAIYRQVLDLVEPGRRRHESVRISTTRNLATEFAALGELERAERTYADAIEAADAFRGLNHPNTANTRLDRAITLVELGRVDEGYQEALRSLQTLEAIDGVSPPLLSRAACAVGEIARLRGDLADARARFERCIELRQDDEEGLAEAQALLEALEDG